MSDVAKDVGAVKKGTGGKPLQLVSYAEKNRKAWQEETMDFFIDKAVFDQVTTTSRNEGIRDKGFLYDMYNNIIDESVFNYVSDPLKSTNEKYKRFPAKIRPYNIFRPNADLLIGEWNKRPFKYDVINVDGDDAYNSFVEFKTKIYRDNLTQRFINTVNQMSEQQGGEGTGLPSEQIPDPKTVISETNVGYKDAKALRGYRALRVLEHELRLREVWRRLFKDWIIAGEVFTLKLPMHGGIEYLRLSPRWVAYDRSSLSPYIEDGDHAVVRFRMTTSELADFFYDKLTKEDMKELELEEGNVYSSKLYDIFKTKEDSPGYKHDVYFVTWKTRKQTGILNYPDPLTGEMQMTLVDESYKVDKEAGETIQWIYPNEVYAGWRINEDRYLGIGPIQAQRNEMNHFSACKLPVNGRRFSDTESENVSIAYLSVPYQILYIILMYRMELTIAKSKGKVVLLDANVIPDDDEGGEEAFFWYSEAMGYALVHRDQDGVDRSWNQYQVLDLSLFQHIKELMGLMDYVKMQLEELLGITRQRKGDINSSDGLGTSEQAIFRGSVISDLIFTGFEEFLETELQGLLDNSKYAWVDGKKGYWRNDDGRLEMLNLEPEDFINADYGVFVENMSKYLDKLRNLKEQVNAIAQRKDVKTSTIVDIVTTESLTELKALVKKAEAVEQELLAMQAENEQQAKLEQEEAARKWELFKAELETEKQERDWDRQDNHAYIVASLDKDKEAPADNSYLAEVEKASVERLKLAEERRKNNLDNDNERRWQEIERMKVKSNERVQKQKNAISAKSKASTKK